MDPMQGIPFIGSPAGQKRASAVPVTMTLLRFQTERLGEVLAAAGLCVRVTYGGCSIIIGDRRSIDDPVEFHFTSHYALTRAFQRLRLLDFAALYFDGGLDVIGPISKAVDILDALNAKTDHRQTFLEYFQLTALRAAKALIPSVQRRFESLSHYEQDAAAYELFLDDYMQYTCGHFPTGREDITQAQMAKFDLIEKLVTPHLGSLAGREHLDVGCGWGGMAAYFTTTFGAHSIGNTNCPRQLDYARTRYGTDVIYGDFSVLKAHHQRFDLVTIVGMIEHLTPYRRSQLLGVVDHILKPDGVVYLQCITRPSIWIGGDAYRVAQKVIFPGHHLETSDETARALERSGFRILDSCEGGHDYGRTTAQWVNNLERNKSQVIARVGERQYRMFVGYLAFASKMFSTDRGSLMRYVLTRS